MIHDTLIEMHGTSFEAGPLLELIVAAISSLAYSLIAYRVLTGNVPMDDMLFSTVKCICKRYFGVGVVPLYLCPFFTE